MLIFTATGKCAEKILEKYKDGVSYIGKEVLIEEGNKESNDMFKGIIFKSINEFFKSAKQVEEIASPLERQSTSFILQSPEFLDNNSALFIAGAASTSTPDVSPQSPLSQPTTVISSSPNSSKLTKFHEFFSQKFSSLRRMFCCLPSKRTGAPNHNQPTVETRFTSVGPSDEEKKWRSFT